MSLFEITITSRAGTTVSTAFDQLAAHGRA